MENIPGRTFRVLNRIFFKCGHIFSTFSSQKSNGLTYDNLSYFKRSSILVLHFYNTNSNTCQLETQPRSADIVFSPIWYTSCLADLIYYLNNRQFLFRKCLKSVKTFGFSCNQSQDVMTSHTRVNDVTYNADTFHGGSRSRGAFFV